MFRFKKLTSFILTILLFINSSFALYRDQAGVIDWYQALVGTPKISYFQKVFGRSNLIVATEHNVIANLNLRSEAINWRHVFKDEDKLITIIPLENYVVSLSESKSSNIRIWNGQNGYLVTEFVINNSKEDKNIENGDLLINRNSIYALIHGNTIVKINIISKSQEGKFKLNNNNYSKLFYNEKSNEIIAIGKNEKGQLIISVLESSGKVVSEKTVSGVKFNLSDAFLGDEALVVRDINGKLHTVTPTSGSDNVLSFDNVDQLVHVNNGKFVVKTTSGKTTLVKIDSSIKTLASFENNDESVISVFTNDADSFVSKTSVSKKNSSVVEIMDANNAKISKVFTIENNYSNFGEITNASLDSYRKKDGTILYRLFTITKDGSVHLYKENDLVWDREESLSDIVDLKFIALPELTKDIPEAIINTDNSGFIAKATSRIQYQISLLKNLLNNKKSDSKLDDDILKRDIYGFRQLLLFFTKKGKLVCMETLTKKTIWTRFIGKDIQGFEGIKLTNIRSSAVQFPPVVATIASFNDNGKESTIISSINAITGEDYTYTNKAISSTTKFPYKILQTFRLSIEEKQDKTRVIVLVKSESEVEFYPNIPEVLEMDKPLYFNLNDKIGGNTIKGYKLYINENKKPQIDFLYSKTFPDGEVIAGYGFKEPIDIVASLGKVLGNRNVLYKYLNPNILVVATIKPNKEYTSTLSLYFLDTVKGSIIHHSFYEGGGETSIMKPKIIQYENKIVCAFWNHGIPITDENEQLDKEAKKLKKNIKKGTHVVVFELYESEIENQKDTNQEFSSFNYLQPYIVSKSFLFDNVITSIGVTTTRNSIANREVIVGLDNNEIYGIPSLFLNARRKIHPPTNDDKQELLIQYFPSIPNSSQNIMTHTLSVSGIKTIISNPATLESTSLVVAYGLDVFLTRRSPSETFDVLSDSFNKPFLIITMATVGFAVIYTGRKIKDNEFKRVWKIKSEKKEDEKKRK